MIMKLTASTGQLVFKLQRKGELIASSKALLIKNHFRIYSTANKDCCFLCVGKKSPTKKKSTKDKNSDYTVPFPAPIFL